MVSPACYGCSEGCAADASLHIYVKCVKNVLLDEFSGLFTKTLGCLTLQVLSSNLPSVRKEVCSLSQAMHIYRGLNF